MKKNMGTGEKARFSGRSIVTMGMLIGIEVVLSRFFSFSAWNMKIGFAFLPVVVAAMMLGPVNAGIVAGLADFIGALLFPIGTYFPGFTLTAFLTGAVYGIFLYRRQTLVRALLAVGINQLVLSLFLNSLWISILYGSPYAPLLVTRLTQVAVMIPVQVVVIGIIPKRVGVLFQKEKTA